MVLWLSYLPQQGKVSCLPVVNRGHLSSNIWLVILETSASVDILEIPEQNDTVLIWCVLAREMQNSAQPKNLGKSGYNIYIF